MSLFSTIPYATPAGDGERLDIERNFRVLGDFFEQPGNRLSTSIIKRRVSVYELAMEFGFEDTRWNLIRIMHLSS